MLIRSTHVFVWSIAPFFSTWLFTESRLHPRDLRQASWRQRSNFKALQTATRTTFSCAAKAEVTLLSDVSFSGHITAQIFRLSTTRQSATGAQARDKAEKGRKCYSLWFPIITSYTDILYCINHGWNQHDPRDFVILDIINCSGPASVFPLTKTGMTKGCCAWSNRN